MMPTTHELLDAVARHQQRDMPRRRRLWDYYRNPMTRRAPLGACDRPHRYAQEQGLPPRLAADATHTGQSRQRERVIENDIAWRIHTLVDFLFGRPFALHLSPPLDSSSTSDRSRRAQSLLNAVIEQQGGVGFFQQLALLGSVYGFADLLVQLDPAELQRLKRAQETDPRALARAFRVELIDPANAIAMLDPHDYRRVRAYAVYQPDVPRGSGVSGSVSLEDPPAPGRAGMLDRLTRRLANSRGGGKPTGGYRLLVCTPERISHYQAGRAGKLHCVSDAANPLGRIPLVHIQNLPQPFAYEGQSEVEPLIPLQDELNVRLCDRANRVTFQSFKMYLGRGIDQFIDRPVGPGQMWATDNPNASIQEFGGDAESPSEEAHINEIREALDKTSAVSPVAAGMLRGKVGNLTSENALRIVLMGLLSRTEKKRIAYGAGLRELARLVLTLADQADLLKTAPAEREVAIDWPDPMPRGTSQQLRDAQIKQSLGVPGDTILRELGYGPGCVA